MRGSWCSPGARGDPADSVSFAYYMRNLSESSFEYEINASDGPYGRGPITEQPASTGCGRVPPDWELLMWAAGEIGIGDQVASVSAAEVGPIDPVIVWVSMNPAGQVQTGLGVPAWWGADIQRCP